MKKSNQLKKFINNNKLLVRLIGSFLISSTLFTTILMVVVSSFISSSIQEKTTDSQQDFMRHSYNTTYYALTDIYVDFYQLWSKDEAIVSFLTSTNPSPQQVKAATSKINNSVFRDELVDSVYLINKPADAVLSNVDTIKTVSNFHDQSAIELFNEFERNYESFKDEVFFPRKSSFTLYDNQNNKQYISIVYAIKDQQETLSNGLVVNIDQNKLSALLNTEDERAFMLIANSSGQIISDSSGKNFTERLEVDDFYKKIANSNLDENNFVGIYNNEKSFVTYKKASTIGFVFISITPYSYLMDEVSTINKVIAIFFVLAMSINLLVSIIAIRLIYQPLNRLIKKMKDNPIISDTMGMDEYAFLEDTYTSLLIKNKRASVFSIFKGNAKDDVLTLLKFTNKKFLVFVVSLDEQTNQFPDMLERLLSMIEIHPHWAGAITSNETLSFIINDNEFDETTMNTIMEDLISIQSTITETLDMSVSIGIGTIINSLSSINISHRYAHLAINYARSIGENQIVLYNEIDNISLAASINKDTIAEKIEQYVLDNYTRQDFSVEEIAEEAELSLGYIRQIFKAEKNITLNEYIISTRIEKAKQLLRDTEDTAKDISEAVGYYDNRYFYTMFKKKVGMTTEEYRQSQREDIG